MAPGTLPSPPKITMTKLFNKGVPGAIVGGLLIGLIETFTGSYINFAFKEVFTFLIMIGVLLFRPAGLMGGRTA